MRLFVAEASLASLWSTAALQDLFQTLSRCLWRNVISHTGTQCLLCSSLIHLIIPALSAMWQFQRKKKNFFFSSNELLTRSCVRTPRLWSVRRLTWPKTQEPEELFSSNVKRSTKCCRTNWIRASRFCIKLRWDALRVNNGAVFPRGNEMRWTRGKERGMKTKRQKRDRERGKKIKEVSKRCSSVCFPQRGILCYCCYLLLR